MLLLRLPLMVAAAVLIVGCVATGAAPSGAPPSGGPPLGSPSESPAANVPIGGRTFLSTSVVEGGAEKSLVPGTRVRLRFAGGTLIGSVGCNTMSGSFRVDAGRLEVLDLATTEMGCDPPRHAQDEWLATFLGSRPAMTADASTLTLEQGSTRLVLVDRRIADPDQPLAGPTWLADGIIDGDAVSNVGSTSAALTFSDGRVLVDTGCNTGEASYAEDPGTNTLRFSGLGLTKRACTGANGAMEQAVVAVLRSEAVTWEIEASRLTLRAGDRGLMLVARTGG